MSRTEQMCTNELIAAWRTIVPTVLPIEIATIIERMVLSQERFVIVSSSMFNETKKEPDDAEDGFVQVIALSDEDIITLVTHLAITWNGLPHFTSAWDLLQQNAHETSLQFALRKLSALRTPLIHGDPKHPLNDWHLQHKDQADSLDIALADTAFFYDADNNRLIIRHAVVDMSDELFAGHYHAIMEQVRNHILGHLSLESHGIDIKHVIPCIERGNLSKHIVLALCDESYDLNPSSSIVIERKIDPRVSLNDIFPLSPTRQSVKVQNIWDNVNCGRYTAILCVAAARILSEHADSTCDNLTPAVFLQFPALLDAKNQSVAGLKDALHTLAETPYTFDRNADHQAIEYIAGLLSSLSFIAKRASDASAATAASTTIFTPQ